MRHISLRTGEDLKKFKITASSLRTEHTKSHRWNWVQLATKISAKIGTLNRKPRKTGAQILDFDGFYIHPAYNRNDAAEVTRIIPEIHRNWQTELGEGVGIKRQDSRGKVEIRRWGPKSKNLGVERGQIKRKSGSGGVAAQTLSKTTREGLGNRERTAVTECLKTERIPKCDNGGIIS